LATAVNGSLSQLRVKLDFTDKIDLIMAATTPLRG